MMRWAMTMCLTAACLGGGGGGGGGGGPWPDDWAGTWDASIALRVVQGGQTRTSTTTDVIATTVNGSRWQWTREGPCTIRWSLDGSTARADAGQRCTLTGDAGTVTIALVSGTATLDGSTLRASLRWTLDGAPGAELAEDMTARRRP